MPGCWSLGLNGLRTLRVNCRGLGGGASNLLTLEEYRQNSSFKTHCLSLYKFLKLCYLETTMTSPIPAPKPELISIILLA